MEGKNCFRVKWKQEPLYSGGNVATCKLAGDGPWVAAMACGGTVNLTTLREGKTLASYTTPIEDVILNVDCITIEAKNDAEEATEIGTFVAVSTRALQVCVLRLVQKEKEVGSETSFAFQVVKEWTAGQQAVSLVRFTPDGTGLFSGATDGNVRIWDVHHHHLTHNLRCGGSGMVSAVRFSPQQTEAEASLLVVGSAEGHLTVFNFVTKKIVASSRLHTASVEAITEMPSHPNHFTSVGRDRKIVVWEVVKDGAASKIVEKRGIAVIDHITCAVFERPELLHLGTLDGVVSSFSVSVEDKAKNLARSERPPGASLEADEELSIRSISVIPSKVEIVDTQDALSSSLIVAADASFNIKVHSTAKDTNPVVWSFVGSLDQVLDLKLLPISHPVKKEVEAAADAHSKKKKKSKAKKEPKRTEDEFRRLVVTNSKEVNLFAGSGAVSQGTLKGHSDIALCVAVSKDGTTVATGSKDRTVRFWRFSEKEVLPGIQQTVFQCFAVTSQSSHLGEVTAVSFNQRLTDGMLMCASVSADEALRLWDLGVKAVQEYAVAEDLSAPLTLEKARFSISNAHAGAIHCVAFSPNDALVATGGKDKAVNVWNLMGKKLFKEASMGGHRRAVNSVAFSPVDKVLASSSNDGSIRLWSLASFTCVKVLQSDKTPALHAQYFNKGTQIVSANSEGVIKVWALAVGECVASAATHDEKVWALSVDERVNEGATFFITGSSDGTIAVTEDFTAEETERLAKERHEAVLQEQKLTNAMRQDKFAEAFMLALHLNHPRHLRQVLTKWIAVGRGTNETEKGVTETIKKLAESDLHRLLEFTREWIANSRNCIVASLVVHSFLGAFHFKAIEAMPVVQHLLEAVMSYSHRHASRLGQQLQQLYYIDYLCRNLHPELTSTTATENRGIAAIEGKGGDDHEVGSKRLRGKQPSETPEKPASKKIRKKK